jgi:lauroyl/myristoyl acyltransferase
MTAAGVYRPDLEDQALQRATEQLSFLMHVVRAGFPDSGVPERFRVDDSLHHLHQAYDGGKGVLVISPHLCCYPIMPRVLDDYVPCSIYLRRSPNPGKHAINMAMGRAGGGHLIHPPANASSVEELMTTLRILRQGRALFITPDVPRKPNQGVPVTIFGRTVYLPTGVMIMAMRSGAPIVIATWHCLPDGIYHVHLHEPMDFSARGNRQARAAAGMRHFAQIMDDFLHIHPEMWWNWLDKRWSRILSRPR